MIRKIAAAELRPGMFVHDLDCGWMAHPFLRNRFRIEGEKQIERIVGAGIRELYIDTSKGLGAANAPTLEETQSAIQREAESLAVTAPHPPQPPQRPAVEEFKVARRVFAEANQAVRSLLQDARLGKQVSVEAAEPVVGKIADSILRNRGALLSLCAIKTKDEYTFTHSVSIGALMMAFCRASGMDEPTVREAGLGGLLHDIGKMTIPDRVLNKPGRLTDEEFELMRGHVVASREILEKTPGIGRTALAVAAEHHERHDGSGYPLGLKGEAISRFGQMAAIVDVYDAITSDRVYHKGLPAAAALKKMLEWSRAHFNPELVHGFVRTLGIYPTGSLVILESGRLAVVLDQNEANLLTPTVRVVYDTRRAQFVAPEDVDLARATGRGGADRILGHAPQGKWSIDPLSYLEESG